MKVLLAVDGSDASEAAVNSVRARPWPDGSEIRVLSVAEPAYPPPPSPAGMVLGGSPYSDTSLASVQKWLLERASEIAHTAASALEAAGRTVQAVAVRGDPRDVIIEQASEWPADLIILGSHGRTGLRRWILGSVAESVLRHAHCSVEVARATSRSDGS